jgi:uncharacterized protein YecA (UPF0149 family)
MFRLFNKKKKDRESLRKQLEEEGKQAVAPVCPCGCGKKMEYNGFLFFDDPCPCGSGKKAIECCYKDKVPGGGSGG